MKYGSIDKIIKGKPKGKHDYLGPVYVQSRINPDTGIKESRKFRIGVRRNGKVIKYEYGNKVKKAQNYNGGISDILRF